MTTNEKAIKTVLEAYEEKRKAIVSDIKALESDLESMRKNAHNRQDVINRIECRKNWLKECEEKIHSADSFECVVDEYAEITEKIANLCEKRRGLFSDQIIVSEFESAKRNGFASV